MTDTQHKDARVALRLDNDLAAAITAVAKAEQRTLSDMIRILARESLQSKHGFEFDGTKLVVVPPTLKIKLRPEVENGLHS